MTDGGIRAVETRASAAATCSIRETCRLHTAVQDSLHAHVLLQRDVDYVVNGGAMMSVDEFKGRIVAEPALARWAAHRSRGKEGVGAEDAGPDSRLGDASKPDRPLSEGVRNDRHGRDAGRESWLASTGLDVDVIPTHRPVIRVDHPDAVFETQRDKEAAVIEEIRSVHRTGRPVLVGTRSVEESERLSERLANITHQVLNARHEEQEAAMIARAGDRARSRSRPTWPGAAPTSGLAPGVRPWAGCT